jgi:DNA polymerase III subunit epsilon
MALPSFWVSSMKFVAIDFETANRSATSACAIGLVVVENEAITRQEHFLIKPPSREFEFTYVHGLTWQDVAKAPTFGELWPQINNILSGAEFFAAHNASFDRNVLHQCCDCYGVERPVQPFQCTVQLARRTWNIRPTKLPNVCDYLNIELEHHQALSDASACAQIVIKSGQVARV